MLGRIAGRFARVAPRRRARAFVLGLLADLPCKKRLDDRRARRQLQPNGLQHLLGRAVWDHDGVRDDVRA